MALTSKFSLPSFGKRWVYAAIALGFISTVLTVLVYPLLRPIRDDWVFDGEVMAIAMDWRDFGNPKAQERLGWILSKRNLQGSIQHSDCTFSSDEDGVRTIHCAWNVVAVWPVFGWTASLDFESSAAIDSNGKLFTP